MNSASKPESGNSPHPPTETSEHDDNGVAESGNAAKQPDRRKKPNESKTIDSLHRFNPWIAERYGLVDAVVYQYFAWLIATKGSAVRTLDQLCEVFPYLGRDQVRRALENLSTEDEEKVYEQGDGLPALLDREPVGKQFVYRLAATPRKRTPHGFDPEMAKKYGLPAAILYDDFARWIIGNDLEQRFVYGDTPYHYESASQWASVHPYISLRTVERCLKTLQSAGELLHVTDPLGGQTCYAIKEGVRIPVWTIPFGIGKVDRWNLLHSKKPTSKPRAEKCKQSCH